MNEIIVNYTGNGYAYVDNPYPSFEELFTLYAYPNAPDTLDDIVARDAQGMYIAMDPHAQQQTLRYREAYGDHITIDVTFSNVGPTPPTPPTPLDPNIVILLKQKDKYFIPNLK